MEMNHGFLRAASRNQSLIPLDSRRESLFFLSLRDLCACARTWLSENVAKRPKPFRIAVRMARMRNDFAVGLSVDWELVRD
jgi:hypothetical protein